MSVDTPAPSALPECSTDVREGPQPVVHSAACALTLRDGGGLYDVTTDHWREHVGDRDAEPFAVDAPQLEASDWLDVPDDEDAVLLLTTSRWKAGTGEGDQYSAWYDRHLRLRFRDADGNLYKPAQSLHVEIMPQDPDLVYRDGNDFVPPYGPGTRVAVTSAWPDGPESLEYRAVQAIRQVYGRDAVTLADAVDESRRIQKLEAFHRFQQREKNWVVEAVEQSKGLIAYGGHSEIQAWQQRDRYGWLEARVTSDRWDLLGFDGTRYARELKVYQTEDWHQRPDTDPLHHPKIEASFDGVSRGPLPKTQDWADVLDSLRTLVSAHLDWANVDREDLVADPYQAGPDVPSYEYGMPVGRREQLRERYENLATELYREATKTNTSAVYDVLKVLTAEGGATYDVLERRTGLARSTVRYHCRRLSDVGVVARLGNPCLVVFSSLDLEDRAREIVSEVRPGDTLEDLADRAEDRRERRERLREQRQQREDAEQDHAGDTGQDADTDASSASSSGGDRPQGWLPLHQLDMTREQLAGHLTAQTIRSAEVAVRGTFIRDVDPGG